MNTLLSIKNIKALSIGLVVFAIWTGGASAQQQVGHLAAEEARTHRGFGGESLTLPSPASPPAAVAAFLSDQGFEDQVIESLVLAGSNRSERFGRTHLSFIQEVDGLRVHGAYVKAAADDGGALLQVIERLVDPAGRAPLPASIDEGEALATALADNHPEVNLEPVERGRSGTVVTFAGNAELYSEPTVERVVVAARNGRFEEGFLVETWGEADNQLYHTLVDGNGGIVAVELRTANDSYNVYPDDPGNSSQTVRAGPGAGNVESPDGWLWPGIHSSVDIFGNNVHAYLDRNGNNVPDGGGVDVNDGNFLTAADLTADPTTAENQDVAVQNLFYTNNVVHDRLYGHGFTESAGNFQEDNFGAGGAGGDSVNAEAQDGGGTNNANFATPADGSNPRMQMYLWTQTNPRRDGDLDSDIVYHEYGHGLTWRMIGGMSGPLSGAIGEGASDVLSILWNDSDVVGEYATDDPNGIRSAPYTDYPRTLGDFTGGSVHLDGEIHAATIWRLWEIFQDEGLSKGLLLDYIVDGMSFTFSGPDYVDMRDGMLQSAAGSGHECLIWEAFADFGIGDGANITVKTTGNPFNRIRITESFALPDGCGDGGGGGGDPEPSGDSNLEALNGSGQWINNARWRAAATITVHDQDDLPVAGVEVSGDWIGAGGGGGCTTEGDGTCTVTSSAIHKNTASVSYEVTALDGQAPDAGGVQNPVTISSP